jgi:hypothetical protein
MAGEQAQQRQRVFNSKEADFAATVDDYNTVTRSQSLSVTPHMVETLQNAEKGPEVLYYLAKNPEVSANLARMNPLDMAMELGAIQATKLVKPEKTVKTPAAPPAKLSPVNSTVRIKSNTPESDKLSDAEWLKRERKRLAAK